MDTLTNFLVSDTEKYRERRDLYSSKPPIRRISLLLEIRRDMEFNVGLYSRFKSLELTDEQNTALKAILPHLTVPLLFITAVDLIGRVINHRQPNANEIPKFFKQSAQNIFEIPEDATDDLWRFRCSLAHQYRVTNIILSAGSSQPVEKLESGQVRFYVRAMYSRTRKVINETLPDFISNSPEKVKIIEYIEKEGFHIRF